MTRSSPKPERLRLREWGEADGDRFYSIMNTPAVMRHLGGVQDRRRLGCGVRAHRWVIQRDHGHTFWLVERKADGELLGFCGLKRVNAPGGTDLAGQFEIGWRLRESAWGQGLCQGSGDRLPRPCLRPVWRPACRRAHHWSE